MSRRLCGHSLVSGIGFEHRYYACELAVANAKPGDERVHAADNLRRFERWLRTTASFAARTSGPVAERITIDGVLHLYERDADFELDNEEEPTSGS